MTSYHLETIKFYQDQHIRRMREFVNNLEKVTKQFQEVVELIKEKDIKFK